MNGKIGSNWFDEDPEWRELKRRIDNQPAPMRRPPRQPKAEKPASRKPSEPEIPKKVQVSINLTIPKVKLPRPSRKQVSLAVLGLAIIPLGLAGNKLLSMRAKDQSATGQGTLSETVLEPEFDTVLPGGKKEETASGKLGYDPERKVASYTDQIGTVDIVVSQQPFPENFMNNPEAEMEKLAKSLGATEIIIESNPKAYLGTSAKGPQTAVFHKKSLLVFIQSARGLSKEEWAAYITQLL